MGRGTGAQGSPFVGDTTYAMFARLVRVQTRLWNEVDAALRTGHGTTLADVTSLQLVADLHARRVQDIVDTLHITVGGASKVVDRLVAAGLVVRATNPEDRRSAVLSVTPAGRALLVRVKPDVDAVLARELSEPLSPTDLAGLDRILTSLHEPHPDPGSGSGSGLQEEA
jgi:DNA-binding MarR family transcriptional regulator